MEILYQYKVNQCAYILQIKVLLQVTKLMASLQDHCYGISLAGAGGGGYLYALKANSAPLDQQVCLDGLTCDVVEVDPDGLEIWVGGENVCDKSVVEDTLTHVQLNELLQKCS